MAIALKYPNNPNTEFVEIIVMTSAIFKVTVIIVNRRIKRNKIQVVIFLNNLRASHLKLKSAPNKLIQIFLSMSPLKNKL